MSGSPLPDPWQPPRPKTRSANRRKIALYSSLASAFSERFFPDPSRAASAMLPQAATQDQFQNAEKSTGSVLKLKLGTPWPNPDFAIQPALRFGFRSSLSRECMTWTDAIHCLSLVLCGRPLSRTLSVVPFVAEGGDAGEDLLAAWEDVPFHDSIVVQA